MILNGINCEKKSRLLWYCLNIKHLHYNKPVKILANMNPGAVLSDIYYLEMGLHVHRTSENFSENK